MRAGAGKTGNPTVSKITILPGMTFGYLTILEQGPAAKHGHYRWWCLCKCGSKILVWATALRSGTSTKCRSCASTSHGWTKTPTYKAWENMHSRCNTDPDCAYYTSYAGRGIKVCKRWNSFENFLEDMGTKPKGLSLDRRDNNGNYEPDNCRWATQEQQANNGRHNVVITHEGSTKTLAQWARHLNMTRREAGRFFGVPT